MFLSKAELSRLVEQTNCGDCGGQLAQGFGLMGGGYGIYVFCTECEFFAKHNEELEDSKPNPSEPRT